MTVTMDGLVMSVSINESYDDYLAIVSENPYVLQVLYTPNHGDPLTYDATSITVVDSSCERLVIDNIELSTIELIHLNNAPFTFSAPTDNTGDNNYCIKSYEATVDLTGYTVSVDTSTPE